MTQYLVSLAQSSPSSSSSPSPSPLGGILILLLLIIGGLCLLNYLLKNAKKKRQLSQLGNGGVVSEPGAAPGPALSYERKGGTMGIADEITKLKQLHDSGALSAQEYETAKARVLAG